MRRSTALLLALIFSPLALDAATSTSGEMKLWHKVTVDLAGPDSSETSATNPFRDYRLDVTFTAPNGAVRTVPGYFAADGNAGETSATSGTVWRAHLIPDQIGTWSYAISFKTGSLVSVNGGGTPASGDDGATGTFVVGASDKTGADFRAPDKGRLDYVGEPALRWNGGGRFFKTAMNHPETFLEYQDFDNTASTRTYPDHIANWSSGDPVWKSTKGKGIIGVVNYVSGQGVNELYFLTMNSRGDGKQAFPWTTSEAKWNYDVSKLAQWGVVFDHMMRKGVMPQFVLEECENQLLFEVLDGTPAGGIADSRKLYYREMVARFGYLNAVIWNIGEENGWNQGTAWGAATSDAQRKARATALRSLLTPQAHIVVHNGPSNTDAIFTGLVAHAGYSGISFQGNLSDTGHGNGRIGYWHTQSRTAGRPWVIAYDEPYLGGTPSRDEWRIKALWACLTGGGTGVGIYSSSDLSLQNYSTYAAHFGDMRRAQTFLSANAVPYWEMVPSNSLVSTGYCLAKASSTYVVYLPSGGVANLTVPAGTYTVDWFDPRNDAALVRTANLVSTGTAQSLGTPPNNTASDWAVLVRSTASPAGSINLSSSTYAIAEGNSGTTTVTVTVNRTGGSSGTALVNYATSNGSATAVSDYVAASGTLTWANGDAAAKTFTITVNGDTAVEANETVTVTLSSVSGASLGSPSTGTLTITNDDVAAPLTGSVSLSSATYAIAEGNSGTSPLTVTVNRTGGSSGAASVNYATSNGSATAGSDYVAASGTLNWADGDAAAKTFTITVNGDTTVESDETVAITLSAASGATMGSTATGTLTITNDDASAGTLVLSSATYAVAEGNSGTSTVTVTVNRTGGSSGAASVNYATSNGSATVVSDYVAASGTLNWANGDATAKTFTITVNGDTTVESDETVAIALSAASGASLGSPSTGTLTITNDDLPIPPTPAMPTVVGDGTPTPTLSGVTQPGATVRIFVNGIERGTVIAAGDGSWSFPVSGLLAGAYAITVTAGNASGTSAASAPVNVTVAGTGGGGSGSSGGGSGGGCGLGAVSAMLLLMLMALFVRKP